MLVSGTVQSLPGPESPGELRAADGGRREDARPSPLRHAANVTVGLIKPGTQFGDRVKPGRRAYRQAAALARMRETVSPRSVQRAERQLDPRANNTFGSAWRRPLQIMPPRLPR